MLHQKSWRVALGRGVWCCVVLTAAGLALATGCNTRDVDDEPAAELAEVASPIEDTRSAPGENTFIYWGDNHVHTRFSLDAWSAMHGTSMIKRDSDPYQACEFAKHCSRLDFFVSTEHAEFLSDDVWDEARRQIANCQADLDPAETSFVAYQGFEWTQMPVFKGHRNFYGHKLLHFLNLEDPDNPATAGATTKRPIASASFVGSPEYIYQFLKSHNPYKPSNQYPGSEFVEMLTYPPCGPGSDPRACSDVAVTAEELFAKLDDWRSVDPKWRQALVGSHGTAWGVGAEARWQEAYTQADYAPYDAKTGEGYETYIEVYSKHGNSEQYVELPADFVIHKKANGNPSIQGAPTDEECNPYGDEPVAGCRCRAPQQGDRYVPCCWTCYEWIEEVYCKFRPLKCKKKKAEVLTAGTQVCRLLGKIEKELPRLDWGECGQCPASGAEVPGAPEPLCFKPAASYEGRGAVQAALAHRLPPGCAKWVAGCDATIQSCVCEIEQPDDPKRHHYELGFISATDTHHVAPGSVQQEKEFAEIEAGGLWSAITSMGQGEPSPKELQRSYWYTGGLAAVHVPAADSNSLREGLFEAFRRREIYATSGPRIKLWFYLTNPNVGDELPMGSTAHDYKTAPEFRVRAVGALKETGDCSHVKATQGYAFAALTCHGTCYAPGKERHAIERVEVIRVVRANSSNADLGTLIQDPYKTLPCDPATAASEAGCTVTFSDPDYAKLGAGVVYYVRAIQEQTLSVNGDTVRCQEYENGRCVKSRPCTDSKEDDCSSPTNERAWSSPIYLYSGSQP